MHDEYLKRRGRMFAFEEVEGSIYGVHGHVLEKIAFAVSGQSTAMRSKAFLPVSVERNSESKEKERKLISGKIHR